MKKINVGVVGVGIFGVNHIKALKNDEYANLTCFVDLNEETVKKVEEEYSIKGYTSLEEMLEKEDLDAVTIATPDHLHVEPALQAIEKGKHVLIEKPIATTIEDAETIMAAAEKHNVRVAVDFHKRWDPASINMKNRIDDNTLGRLIRGYMNMDDIIDVPMNWLKWSAQSSPAHFLGIHCYDLIRWYMGCEATEVYAKGHKTVLKEKGIDTYDNIQAFITFENGCIWTVETSWIYPNEFPKANDGRTSLLGEFGLIRNNSQNRGTELYTNETTSTPNVYFLNEFKGETVGFGVQPIKDFAKDIVLNKPFLADGYDGIEAAKIDEAVHRSVRENKAIQIER